MDAVPDLADGFFFAMAVSLGSSCSLLKSTQDPLLFFGSLDGTQGLVLKAPLATAGLALFSGICGATRFTGATIGSDFSGLEADDPAASLPIAAGSAESDCGLGVRFEGRACASAPANMTAANTVVVKYKFGPKRIDEPMNGIELSAEYITR